VRLIISTWLDLALRVDEPNSLELFDHLSALLGTGIIEGIWIYSIQNLVAMKATLDALPSVLRTLGIATTSFLKVCSTIFQTACVVIGSQKNQLIIPQLAHIMAMRSTTQEQPENISDIIELQKSACRVMLVIIDVAACRMGGWKFTILDGVARCWVGLVDFDFDGIGKSSLHRYSPFK